MTQLETDLRAAFRERAARVHASHELLVADYHPRTRRLRPPVLIGSGLAVAAGAVAAALSLVNGASNAFAGWTPQPTAPTRAQLAAAKAYCTENAPFSGLPLKLTDTRGPFTFEVYSDGSSNDFRTTGPSFTNASGWSSSPPVTVPAGRLFLWAEHTTADSGQAFTFLIAQAGDGVSAANLTLDDGTQVTATVSNGWAVAWWPGSHQLTNAQLTTPHPQAPRRRHSRRAHAAYTTATAARTAAGQAAASINSRELVQATTPTVDRLNQKPATGSSHGRAFPNALRAAGKQEAPRLSVSADQDQGYSSC